MWGSGLRLQRWRSLEVDGIYFRGGIDRRRMFRWESVKGEKGVKDDFQVSGWYIH